jgi:hypothetical protein
VTQTPHSRLHKTYFRNGENHRGGADVSFADIVKVFGFRGIEVGKWVSKQEQQIAANLFFDALCDLMDILQVPESVISLNGTLALAFGVGGRKHVSAHYDSSRRQLALAKNAGGGSLAHEWFHAFDHFISQRLFTRQQSNQFATEMWLNDIEPIVAHPLNQRLENAFRAMFLDDTGTSSSVLVKRSTDADSLYKTFYFARPQEVGARSFERMVQGHHIKNAFLVQGTIQSQEAKMGLYPQDQPLLEISQHLLDYFYLLGQALQHK